MTDCAASYHGYRFPPEIFSYAVWLYHRFCLSFRDTEDLLAQRGITVSYEAIRQWCRTFGPAYARRLRCRQGRLGDTWHLDELFVNIQGRQHYLWRAVDQDGDVIDILVQPRRDRPAAERFFRKLLKGQGCAPRRLITDKLRSYSAAHAIVMPSVVHSTQQYENNRAEVSHQPAANASDRCGGSNPPRMRNGSCRCTDSFGISFAWGVTCYGLFTIGC
jgi:putative transposase